MHIKYLELALAHSSRSMHAHHPYHHSNLGLTKIIKLQIGKTSQSMEGHNDKVFGKMNPHGAKIRKSPFFCWLPSRFFSSPTSSHALPSILTWNILEFPQPPSSLMMSFSSKGTLERPLIVQRLEEGTR